MMEQQQASLERTFSQADFDRFARLSGDANPIHVDPEFAGESRFGRTVAHGMLLLTVLRGLVGRLAPEGRVIEQQVMFPAPTFTGEPMRFVARISGQSQGASTIELAVRRRADGVITCQGFCKVEP
jgi:acyl dehydratase